MCRSNRLKQRAIAGRTEAAVHGQVESLVKKETRDGKPFWELLLADAEAKITLRAWSDAPAFAACEVAFPNRICPADRRHAVPPNRVLICRIVVAVNRQ